MTKAFGIDTARAAFAGGATARLTDYIALGAEVGSLVSPTVGAAWSVALNVLIPGSPHTFSFQASNATTSTLEGNSIGFSKMLYGFEFTIPLHLKRFSPWFHRSPKPVALGAPAFPAIAAEVYMGANKFTVQTVTIFARQAARWTNRYPLVHTRTLNRPPEPRLPFHPPHGR